MLYDVHNAKVFIAGASTLCAEMKYDLLTFLFLVVIAPVAMRQNIVKSGIVILVKYWRCRACSRDRCSVLKYVGFGLYLVLV